MKRDFQIGFLKQVGLQPDHYFLDLGCGTLRGGIPVIQYLKEGRYYGIDVREEALEEGKKELFEAKLAHKNPVLKHIDDISSLDLGEKFTFMWAFSVLIHMTDTILNDCLRFVGKHLEANGCLYANCNIGDMKDGIWQGFPVVWRSLDFYKELSLRNGLHVNDMGPISTLGHISGDKPQDEQRMLKFWRAR